MVEFEFFEKYRYFCGENLFSEFTEIISKFSKINLFYGKQQKIIIEYLFFVVDSGLLQAQPSLWKFSGQLIHKIDQLTSSVSCGLC